MRESLKASTLGSVTLGEHSKDFYLNGGTSDFDEPSMIDQVRVFVFYTILGNYDFYFVQASQLVNTGCEGH